MSATFSLKASGGNLWSMVEHDPANPNGGTSVTSYSYDWMGNLTGGEQAEGDGDADEKLGE